MSKGLDVLCARSPENFVLNSFKKYLQYYHETKGGGGGGRSVCINAFDVTGQATDDPYCQMMGPA